MGRTIVLMGSTLSFAAIYGIYCAVHWGLTLGSPVVTILVSVGAAIVLVLMGSVCISIIFQCYIEPNTMEYDDDIAQDDPQIISDLNKYRDKAPRLSDQHLEHMAYMAEKARALGETQKNKYIDTYKDIQNIKG